MKQESRRMPSNFWAGQSLKSVLTGLHTELRQEMLFIQGYARLLIDSKLESEERLCVGQSMLEHIQFVKSVLEATYQYLADLDSQEGNLLGGKEEEHP